MEQFDVAVNMKGQEFVICVLAESEKHAFDSVKAAYGISADCVFKTDEEVSLGVLVLQ